MFKPSTFWNISSFLTRNTAISFSSEDVETWTKFEVDGEKEDKQEVEVDGEGEGKQEDEVDEEGEGKQEVEVDREGEGKLETEEENGDEEDSEAELSFCFDFFWRNRWSSYFISFFLHDLPG